MEEATTTPRLDGPKGTRIPSRAYGCCIAKSIGAPAASLEPPLLLQSGSLKSRGSVVVIARARVHECHAAEVAIVTALAPTLEEYCLGRNPGACTHPLFLLLPLPEKGKKASPSAFQSSTTASRWQNLMGSQWTKQSEKSFQPLAIQTTA